jgi:hypothetical protein
MNLINEISIFEMPNSEILNLDESQFSFGTTKLKGIYSLKIITTFTPNNIQLKTNNKNN